MSDDFFGYTSAMPRPQAQPEDPTQAALARAVQARHTAKMEEWDRKHQAWLAENEQRMQQVRDQHIAAQTEALKAETRAAYARVGISGAAFDRAWPAILRDHQVAAANADPLESEKQRLRTQADYTM